MLLFDYFHHSRLFSVFCFRLGKNINQLFSLSKKDKIKVFSLLLSMCKLHRDLPSQVYKDKTFTKDGMYDRLYLALYNSVQTMFLKTKQKPPKVITTYKSKLSASLQQFFLLNLFSCLHFLFKLKVSSGISILTTLLQDEHLQQDLCKLIQHL